MFYGYTWNFCLWTRAPGTSLTILKRAAQLSWSCKIWITPELCNYNYFNLSLNTHTCSQNSNEKKKWKSTSWQSNAKSRSRHAKITCKFSIWKQAFVDALSHDADALDVNINCRQGKRKSVACSFCAVWLKFCSGASTLIKKSITTERQYAFYYAKLLLLRGPKPSSCCVLDDCFGEKSSRPGESSTTFITDKLRRRVNACKR